jgi:E3 ubiquitin-protein ligase makorin
MYDITCGLQYSLLIQSLQCIRNWRGQGDSSDELSLTHVHKTCPYCRTPSKFVIPSSRFYPSGHPGKADIIERYKASLRRVPCK